MTDASSTTPPDHAHRGAGRDRRTVVIIGGGPGGYEAALTAARLGADVHLVEDGGLGGAAVLTDVVPSKTLIATADVLDQVRGSGDLGIRTDAGGDPASARSLRVDLEAVNTRVRALAEAQSADIAASLRDVGVEVHRGRGSLDAAQVVRISADDGSACTLPADVVLVATGARPRELATAPVDGERILTWTQLYGLPALPEHLVVVGSGVTGAEFASAYRALGCEVTLVSSRDAVLPGIDAAAAEVLERAFARRGVAVRARTRAEAVVREGDGVRVVLSDGRELRASHCLMAVGAIPATAGLGLETAGVRLGSGGHVEVDRVSRTTAPGVYAAGDCTGVLPLASVAAMQGRIAMHHALGESVSPLEAAQVAQAVFTSPEIAAVGATAAQVEAGEVMGECRTLALAANPRAKMQGTDEGFVRLIVAPGAGTVLGATVVAPRASELIHPLALAVTHRLTADQVAATFTVYPSVSGSLAEVARRPPHRS